MHNPASAMLLPSRRTFDLGLLGGDLIARWSALDYATKMTDAGAGAISQWTDSVAGISLTDVTVAGNRPTYSATSFNSAYPGVTFDGTSDCLAATSFAALPTGATEGEIFAVVSGVNDATVRRIFQFGSITNGANRGCGKTATTNLLNVTDATTSISNPTVSTLVGNAVTNAQFQATVFRGRCNGAAGVNSAAATLNTGGGTLRVRIGGSNANTAANFWSGIISEVLVTTFLTEQRRLAVEGYLAWTYGIQASLALGHPWREQRP